MINTSNTIPGSTAASTTARAQSTGGASPEQGTAGSSRSNTSAFGPATQVDVSDRTKQILQQNQYDMTALETLKSVVTGLKIQINGQDAKQSTGVKKVQSSSAPQPLSMSMLEQVDNYIKKQHTNKDGSISSYDVTVRDIFLTPKTGNEIDNWYQNDGAIIVNGAFDGDSADYKEMVRAIKDKKIEFIDARDIPDLNFHNKATFQGGEGGSSPGLTRTYNSNASIFKDPEKGYYPLADGTFISWAKQSRKS